MRPKAALTRCCCVAGRNCSSWLLMPVCVSERGTRSGSRSLENVSFQFGSFETSFAQASFAVNWIRFLARASHAKATATPATRFFFFADEQQTATYLTFASVGGSLISTGLKAKMY